MAQAAIATITIATEFYATAMSANRRSRARDRLM
jgi:hypothetical protein